MMKTNISIFAACAIAGSVLLCAVLLFRDFWAHRPGYGRIGDPNENPHGPLEEPLVSASASPSGNARDVRESSTATEPVGSPANVAVETVETPSTSRGRAQRGFPRPSRIPRRSARLAAKKK